MKNKIVFLLLSVVTLGVSLVPGNTYAAPGDLYVTELSSGTIFKFSSAGIKSIFASGLNEPVGLAFDAAGNLFVADSGSGTIYRFTPTGTKSTFASGLFLPLGLAFDGAGNLFVADGCASDGCARIYKFTPAGMRNTFAIGQDFIDGNRFITLAFDTLGNLFAITHGFSQNGVIYKFTSAGMRSTFSDAGAPVDMAFDRAGNLFVSDNNGTIFKYTPDGHESDFASDVGGAYGLAFDGAGNLFEANNSTGTIFKFTPAGIKSTFASGLAQPNFLAFEPVTEKLRNLSARGLVQTGDNVVIGGFIVGGNALANNAVIVRAIGPSLAKAGVANPLSDPVIELHNASGAVIATNDNWRDTQAAQISASGLAPSDARESAIFATLPAGNYTAVVRGAGAATGTALVEIYSLK